MPLTEREIKFRLPDGFDAERVREAVVEAGFRLERVESVAHEDRYVDTEDWALYRSGLALRLRADARGTRLEAKTLRSRATDALVRIEWAQDAPIGDPPWSALDPGPVESLLRPLAALHVLERLRVRARLRNDRECFQWLRGDKPLGSLTIDHVNAMNGLESPLAFQEVELEIQNGADEALAEARHAVETRLGLEANVASKLASALAASGERAPELDERQFVAHPADRLIDVAHKTFAKHFGRLLWNEPGTRVGIDPEHLHDMRVACRRLRTALELFENAIPEDPCTSFEKDLRWIGRALGRVRDRDVALERIAELSSDAPWMERGAWNVFRHALELERARCRVRLIERLDSERYSAFVARARAWVAEGPPGGSGLPVGGAPAYTVAPRLVAERTGALAVAYEEAERLVDQVTLHEFRMAAKKARYSFEYFGDACGAKSSRRAKRLAGLQDFLGAHQDALMLLRRLRIYARTVPRRDRELTLGVGSALGHVERSARMRRADLRRAWEQVRED